MGGTNEMIQFVYKMQQWFERELERTTNLARSAEQQFPAFARDCWRDVGIYRSMLEDARRALPVKRVAVDKDRLLMPIDILEDYGLDSRTIVFLQKYGGCETVGDLLKKKPSDLARVYQIGANTVECVQRAARQYLEGIPS